MRGRAGAISACRWPKPYSRCDLGLYSSRRTTPRRSQLPRRTKGNR
jgi:hypothetical protein